MLKDAQMSAASLYDGGWRSSDAEQLKDEYQLTDDELEQIVSELREMEN